MWRVLGVVVLIACSSGRAPLSYEARYARLRETIDLTFALPPRPLRAIVTIDYRALFPAALPARTDDVRVLLKAASLAITTSMNPAFLADVRSALAALEARRVATHEDAAWLSSALIANRLLDEARALATRYPQLERVPFTRDAPDWIAGQPSAWRIDAAGNLERHRIDLHAPQVIVVSSPGCHYSSDALTAIFADATLAPIFAAHATLLIPPSFSLEAASARAWNRGHPQQPTVIAVDERDWPMIEQWATPHFYFVRDGAVVADVRGWPSDTQKANVLAGLAAVGLYDSRSR